MNRKGWLLLLFIEVIATEIIVVKVIDIYRQEKIFISNRFKSNEIILSDDSRQLAKMKPDFKDFTQVPKLEIEISNAFPQKYFHIHGDIHAYVFRVVMGLQQFRQSFEEKSEREECEVVLMRKADEEEARKHVKDVRLFFYSGESISNEQLHGIFKECLKDRSAITSNPQRQQQNTVEKQSGTKIFIISMLTCTLLTVLKLTYLKQLSKKESVV